MSTAARIEELRNKFEENPRRYFAPLANELRKAGDLTQAIALCREHLPKQPGHMALRHPLRALSRAQRGRQRQPMGQHGRTRRHRPHRRSHSEDRLVDQGMQQLPER